MNRTLDVLTSFWASGLRGTRGTSVRRPADAPEQLLELYEFEGCPSSRRVREALTALDLDAMIFPCPVGGQRFRAHVPEVPFLIDPSREQRVGGARNIVDYLFDTYGGGMSYAGGNGRLDTARSRLATALRGGRGGRARPSRPAAEPLELYSFESSPFSRIVRETLSELELRYQLHNVGKGAAADWLPIPLRDRLSLETPPSTSHRRALAERAGRVQVPFLVDPNTGAQMFESSRIRDYLNKTYGGSDR